MGVEEEGSFDTVASGSIGSTGLFSGSDIAAQVHELENRVAQQACKDFTIAVASGKHSAVVHAIDLGAKVDTTLNGYTPLMRAASWGHVETLTTLIAEGADMFATDRRNRTALDWSRIARRDKAARLLERAMENEIRHRRDATKAVRGKRELWAVVQANARHARDVADAVNSRDLEEVKRIVDRAKLSRHDFESSCDCLGLRRGEEATTGRNDSCVGERSEGESSAAMLSDPPMAERKPISPEVDPEIADSDGAEERKEVTVGDIATSSEGKPVFFLDAEGRGGTTALALATIGNDVETVRRLMKEGADPIVEASNGHTALTWAAVCGFDQVAAELLNGLNSNSNRSSTSGSVQDAINAVTATTTVEGKTALHNAALNGNSKVVMLLLDRLRDILLVDSFGAKRRSEDAAGPGLGWFRTFRQFVRQKDRHDHTARDLALQAGHEEVGTLLDNAEGRIEAWEAGERAQEYLLERIECGNDGCHHRDRRDRMERHERTECPRRPSGCPACGKKVAAGDLLEHDEKECDKRNDACPNAFLGCFEVMQHDKIAAHAAHTCKFRWVKCRRGCGASVVAHQLDIHEQEHCKLSKHPCVFGCGAKIVKIEMDKHIKEDCRKRKLRCRVGCGSSVDAGELLHHEQEICTQSCRWEGCGERLGPLIRREVHEQSLCPERPAECAHGCGVRGLTAALKNAHEMHHCQLRLVSCPHGCGASIPNNEVATHVRAEGGKCPERLQRCRFDCLGRRILVPNTEITPETSSEKKTDGDAERGGEGIPLIPGMLRSYDTATGLFGIRYSHGNREQALEDLDFTWADEGGDGGGSTTWACGWIPAAEMTDHLSHSCLHRRIPCRNGCGQKLVVREAENHYKDHCPKRYVLCPLGCETEVRQENLWEHTDHKCSLRSSPCEACGVPVPIASHAKHLASSCVRVPRRCTNGCGSLMSKEDMPLHLAMECPKRVVACPLGCPEEQLWAEEVEAHVRDRCPLQLELCRKGCGQKVAACSREEHEARECSERIVTCECGDKHAFSKTEDHRILSCTAVVHYCSLGCGMKVRKMDMDRHQELHCERKTLRNLSKMIECPLGCGHLILRQWEFKHSTFDCPKRPAMCPGGCSADVTADEVDTHFMTCGRRRIRCGAESTGCERMLLTWLGQTEVSIKRIRDELNSGSHQQAGRHPNEQGQGLVACSDHGSDALMWAAGRGDSEHALLEELIKLSGGASINRESFHGDTALTMACSRGHSQTIRTLVQLGRADVNYETRSGKTALIEAARHGRTAVVRLLMKLHAVIPYKNRRGQTAAWWAKRLGHQDCFLPMMREIKAEATLRLMSSQIARGDLKAVRSLVELGEPYVDNHCERLETEIAGVTRDLEAVAKKLRELTTLKEQLSPELERLKASLAVDLARRRKIKREVTRGTRVHADARGSGTSSGPTSAVISSRSFEAMQNRSIRLFQRSVARFQALTDDDFKKVADLSLFPECTDDNMVDNGDEAPGDGEKRGVTKEKREEEEARNPTPSLSPSSSSDHRLSTRHSDRESDLDGGSSGGTKSVAEEVEESDDASMERPATSSPSFAIPAAAAILRILRATVLVLGGCGLGALPSDKKLWESVKPMLKDGSLKHRVRHFDRRSIPSGLLDGVRVLLNMDVDKSDGEDEEICRDRRRSGHQDRFLVDEGDNEEVEETVLTVDIADGNTSMCKSGTDADTKDDDGAPGVQSPSSTTHDGGGLIDEDNSDLEDGPDPWGDGRGESRWGHRIRIGTATSDASYHGDGEDELALMRALGSWCASISAYDRLVHLAPGSAAQRAADAETEWDELERRITRSTLDVQLEEFSIGLLSEEISGARESVEYLSQKRAWGEDRLGVARLFSLVSPAGHSLVSWAAACGQTEMVEILMNHGATAELGDEIRAVSASIIQAFYRFRRDLRQTCLIDRAASSSVMMGNSQTNSTKDRSGTVLSSDNGDQRDDVEAETESSATKGGGRLASQTEEGSALRKRRTEYAVGMVGRHATLARLRRSRRLPLTEAAYNGHYEVLQYFRMRRTPLYSASRTWLYPSAPPPFAPLGDGSTANYTLEAPMSVADCAEAGNLERGCKQRIPGRGWVGQTDPGNRFSVTEKIAGAIWREIMTVAAMGRDEKDRRRALRVKMRKQEELVRSMDAAIEDGYTKAPEIITLCQEGASIDRETEDGKTALISAAEEEPHAMGHTWVTNEEGWGVMATALLLDRRIHRPKIDYESRVTGHTALTRACSLGRLEVAEVLLDRGADVNRLPKRRPTTPSSPLHRNPRHRPRLRLPALPHAATTPPKSGAAVEAKETAKVGLWRAGGRNCCPPLVAAAAAGHATMVKLLLERGANPEVRDGNGDTAADVARRAAFVDVLGELARKEAGCMGIAAGERGVANPRVPCEWGCGKLLATGRDKIEHEEECSHREVECEFQCGAYRLQKRQLERHLSEVCPLRPVVCSTRCGVLVSAKDYARHQETSCPMRPVTCKMCKNKVVASALTVHESEKCPMRMVKCEKGCGEEVPVAAMERHTSTTCPLVSVRCRLGCGQQMHLKMRAEHERSLCSERLVQCRWQCSEEIKAKHIDQHEKQECRRANTPCGNRCGQYVPLGDMKKHYADECSHRFVPCGLGCGYRVRAKDVPSHESNECGARLISCPLGCSRDDKGSIGAVVFPARALEVHLEYECAFRQIKCAACGDKVTALELDVHRRETCRRRLMACSNEGCCLKLPAADMITHQETTCSRRQVWCLQGCGEQMRADQRRRHHDNACSMRYIPCPLGCPKKVRASEADDHVDFLCVRRHFA